jgi:hypothetical protein
VVLQETIEPKGFPDQQEDAAGTVRSRKPLMLELNEFQSLSEGHEASRAVDLHTGAVWEGMTLAPARVAASRRKDSMF